MTAFKHLARKVALVTGGGGGIGKGIVEKLASFGCRVAVADINVDAARKVAADVSLSVENSSIGIEMDVSSEASVESGVRRCVVELGGIDILVANAGVQHIERIERLSFEDWRRVLGVHLDGSFLLTRAAMRHMIEKKVPAGSIVYIGSVHSKEASPLKAPYVAAKHGVLGLCRAVAVEGGPHNIRSNIICPGFVYTPLVAKQIPEQAKRLGISEEAVVKNVMLKNTVNGEFASIAEVAETTAYVAAMAMHTGGLTGQSITVSNGWHMS
eukprot:Opistho-1_new@74234